MPDFLRCHIPPWMLAYLLMLASWLAAVKLVQRKHPGGIGAIPTTHRTTLTIAAPNIVGGVVSGWVCACTDMPHPVRVLALFSLCALSFPPMAYFAWWMSRSDNIADAAVDLQAQVVVYGNPTSLHNSDVDSFPGYCSRTAVEADDRPPTD